MARDAPTRVSVPANRVTIWLRSFSCASVSLVASLASFYFCAFSRTSDPASVPGSLAAFTLRLSRSRLA